MRYSRYYRQQSNQRASEFEQIDVTADAGLINLTWEAPAKKLEALFGGVLEQTGRKNNG